MIMEEVSAKSVEQDRPAELPKKYSLRELRLARGLSQYRLADMAGITQTMISKIENNERGVGKRAARALRSVFPGYDIEFLKGPAADIPVQRIPDHVASIPIISQADLIRGNTMSTHHLFVPLAHIQKRLLGTLVAFRVIDHIGDLAIPAGAYVVVDMDDNGGEFGSGSLVAIRGSDVDVVISKREDAYGKGAIIGRIVWVSYPV